MSVYVDKFPPIFNTRFCWLMYFSYSMYLIIENTHRRTKTWLNIFKKWNWNLSLLISIFDKIIFPLIFKENFVIFWCIGHFGTNPFVVIRFFILTYSTLFIHLLWMLLENPSCKLFGHTCVNHEKSKILSIHH